MNKVLLVGNVGKDAELKNVGSTTALVFSLATNESYKDANGERKEKGTWHNITIWGKRGEALAPYIKKGIKLGVEGKIDNSTYEKDGVSHNISRVVVNNVEFLTPANKSGEEVPAPEMPEGNDDEIPF